MERKMMKRGVGSREGRVSRRRKREEKKKGKDKNEMNKTVVRIREWRKNDEEKQKVE